MKSILLHFSDIHFRENWEENQGVVLDSLFLDLHHLVEKNGGLDNCYAIFSGDLVYAGDSANQYNMFHEEFYRKLDSLGLPKHRRVCVPGNHDISLAWLKNNKTNHDGVFAADFDEKIFNDYVANESCILFEKFKTYLSFESDFCDYGVSSDSVYGRGWDISENLGVYCLNSALLSSGESKKDEGRLVIETRNIYKWLKVSRTKTKVLVMHHPLSWLAPWARKELENILYKNFSIFLHGHVHDQSVFHSQNSIGNLISISAPPLFTTKSDDLGYAFVVLGEDEGECTISYRQWTKGQTFVTGVNFSNTDNGEVKLFTTTSSRRKLPAARDDVVWELLKTQLEKSLKSFAGQPSIWVDPEVYTFDEKEASLGEVKEKKHIDVLDIIKSPKNAMICAAQQFGLTSLSHYLCMKAWEEGSVWIRLDSNETKIHDVTYLVENSVPYKQAKSVDCIVIDSWSETKNKKKLLNKISELYSETPILVMKTDGDNFFSFQEKRVLLDRDYELYYLHSLPRKKVREIIVQYNRQREIGDDNIVLEKILKDLDVLNLHRTPLNCITLLKVMEVDFDDSPVNRTEVIRRILFLLFNVDNLPTYKRRPDMKDCEHVLGSFCEVLLKRNDVCFSREDFVRINRIFCRENIIDLDIELLFDLLFDNNVIVNRGNRFCFKFTYWMMFFAAQRMHHSLAFRDFIFQDMRYASYPELIEFYAGIDRRRDDALNLLIKDVGEVFKIVKDKLGLPDEIDLYSMARWEPTDDTIHKIRHELENEVENSNLPDIIKDQFADSGYDPRKPYNQEISRIVKESRLELLIKSVIAGSRALRNCDYAQPELKKKLLKLIVESWELLTKIIIVLSPILARDGAAIFEGTKFVLIGDLANTDSVRRFEGIFRCAPYNVLSKFIDDIYSHKMGPLFFSLLNGELSNLGHHYIELILVEKRPRNWKSKLEKYIGDIHKNSFYLYSIDRELGWQQTHGFVSPSAMEDIVWLRKMSWAKHETGAKKPGIKLINKVTLSPSKGEFGKG